ncbi:hypothetical protein SAMN05216344_11534 [Polaromonas sp. OV174]|uniref:hypothetical protein n=1 Tax=Polaromonas sp. OV174 TaxID=1855300 RepID=UPI0008E24EE2|nr:hypothetical protein [Polaromonas sp. OV174]SFC36372.1 hypothetical protein SAMN05216344_11534 [Polaromonas sp. OV174]
METFSTLTPERQAEKLARINTRWGQLHALEKEWGDKVYKYILLTNSGGVIATLGFLGTASKALDLNSARWALLAFITGVLLTGVAVAHRYHRSAGLFWGYRDDVNRYLADKLPWEAVAKQDDARSIKRGGWGLILPYACLGAFWIGCFIGGAALLRAS